MDKFTPDILILGYSGNNTEVRTFSLTGLSPSLVGRSRAVLLTFGFVTSPSQSRSCLSLRSSRMGLIQQPTISALGRCIVPITPCAPRAIFNFHLSIFNKFSLWHWVIESFIGNCKLVIGNCVRSTRFRLCPFRSPLLRVSILFLFLWVLRCFTSPGILPAFAE